MKSDRYSITPERDLDEAVERVSAYVARRAAEAPKVRQLRTPAQNPHNAGVGATGS